MSYAPWFVRLIVPSIAAHVQQILAQETNTRGDVGVFTPGLDLLHVVLHKFGLVWLVHRREFQLSTDDRQQSAQALDLLLIRIFNIAEQLLNTNMHDLVGYKLYAEEVAHKL
jgi:hypothetical protein